MFNYKEFNINENLVPSIGEYELIQSPRGNYYCHKSYKTDVDASWIIEPNGTISVNGTVDYSKKEITFIPFLFNKVSGDFSCHQCNSLNSLQGCPMYVGGSFSCSYCDTLTSLKGSPKSVGYHFYCNNCNSLISLEGCTELINGDFTCSRCNSLISLKGIPKLIEERFFCVKCDSLEYLDYFQSIIKGQIITDKAMLEIIHNLCRQYPLLAEIDDYALFVHTVIEYAPELKQYYKEIPELPSSHQDLSTFI